MEDLFAAAGPLREAYDAVDWSATSLGPVCGWSDTLRWAVVLTLSSRFPITLLWGSELVLVYNAAYVALIADKHPAALGRPAAEVFPEAWDQVGPMLDGVLAHGRATWAQDQLLPLERSGFLEEAWFTFAYSPVRGIDGRVEGVIDVTVETTRQVVLGRRQQLLGGLHQALTALDHPDQLGPAVARALAGHPTDVLAATLHHLGGARDDRMPEAPVRPLGRDLRLEQTRAGSVAWVPVLTGTRMVPVGILLSPMLPLDRDHLDFVRLIGSTISQHATRLESSEAERTMSTTLQLSLLTRPPPSAYDVAVRYLPASELAQVGGDWYDAFDSPDGSLTLVVGDVAGHDTDAAAAMGQLRNLLRGVAYTGRAGPAGVLSGLDRALEGLGVGVLATATVASVRARPTDCGVDLVWSNAGHPPPVLIAPEGCVELLERSPDVLLGVDPGVGRAEHTVTVRPGSTVVLYTDGLVERRDASIDDGLAWLRDSLGSCDSRLPEQVCEHLLAELGGVHTEDDIALLVLHVPGAEDTS